MLRRFLIVLLVFLCACSSTEKKEEYIDPVRDVFIYTELNEDVQERLKEANAGEEYENYQFRMLGNDVYKGKVTDIYGDPADLSAYEKIFFEIVSVKCQHCRRQLHEVGEMLKYGDVKFVQYFNVGTPEDIMNFYAEEGLAIPEDIIVIAKDSEIEEYIRYDLKIQKYPTLICFENGKVSFDMVGELDSETLKKIHEIAFIDPIDKNDLKNSEGTYVPDLLRTADDVREELSTGNLERLRELDNDELSEELTLELIGRSFDPTVYRTVNNSVYYSEIEDYSLYLDRPLVLIYECLENRLQKDRVTFINELIASESGLDFIVVLNEGTGSSSQILRNMDVVFSCPVVSMLAAIPDDLISYEITEFPSAVFINKGTFTGAYSNIAGIDEFHQAVELFLGDASIAYKRNN